MVANQKQAYISNLNFLNYTNLSAEEFSFFKKENLHFGLEKARKLLRPRNQKKESFNYTNGFDFSETEIRQINIYLEFLLTLIGKYSNQRFGETAVEQHRFFQRTPEKETFYIHLFIAIQKYKAELISTNQNIVDEIGAFYIHELHSKLREKEIENAKIIFIINDRKLNEKSLYTIAKFYIFNFIFSALKSNKPEEARKFITALLKNSDGVNYYPIDGKKGGKAKAELMNHDRQRAYELFAEHKYHLRADKVNNIASDLRDFLLQEGIDIAYETLRTRWIKDFQHRKPNLNII